MSCSRDSLFVGSETAGGVDDHGRGYFTPQSLPQLRIYHEYAPRLRLNFKRTLLAGDHSLTRNDERAVHAAVGRPGQRRSMQQAVAAGGFHPHAH